MNRHPEVAAIHPQWHRWACHIARLAENRKLCAHIYTFRIKIRNWFYPVVQFGKIKFFGAIFYLPKFIRFSFCSHTRTRPCSRFFYLFIYIIMVLTPWKCKSMLLLLLAKHTVCRCFEVSENFIWVMRARCSNVYATRMTTHTHARTHTNIA